MGRSNTLASTAGFVQCALYVGLARDFGQNGPMVKQLRSAIRQGAAQGINRGLQVMLADILLNVPRRSGRLASSYQITQYATPETLSGEIRSSVGYSANHYPGKPARFVKSPTLFSTPPSPIGQPTDKLKAMIRRDIERSIAAQIR